MLHCSHSTVRNVALFTQHIQQCCTLHTIQSIKLHSSHNTVRNVALFTQVQSVISANSHHILYFNLLPHFPSKTFRTLPNSVTNYNKSIFSFDNPTTKTTGRFSPNSLPHLDAVKRLMI